MKLHKLYIQNINSLKGEHTIDFDDSVLGNCGIFAIIGPTGSGKSTLLDAITLALFNKVPRIGSISDKIIEEQGVILTKYEDQAKVRLEYSVNAKHYLAEWSIRRARTGKLQPYEISIVDSATGKPLDLKKKQVPEENEKIIGLNYDQFIKSILLSQGEFSKFLKATKNERGTILEKITGTHIFRDLGIATYKQHKNQKNLLEEINKDIERLQLASEETREQWLTDIQGLDKEITALDSQAQDLQVLITGLTKKQELNTDLEAIKSDMMTLQSRKEANAINQLKLEKHKVIRPLLPDLALLETATAQATELTLQVSAAETQKQSAEQALQKAIDKYHAATAKKTTLQTIGDDLTSLKTDYDKISGKIQEITNQGTEENNQLDQVKSDHPNINWDSIIVKDASQSIKNCKAEIAKIKATLDQIPKEHQSYTDPNEELKKTQQQKDAAKAILDLKQKIASDTVLLEEQVTIVTEAKTTKTKVATDLKDLDQKIQANEEQLIAKEVTKQVEMRKMDMDQHRHHLVDGKPCSLCGSTTHPYSGSAPEFDSTLDDQITALKTLAKELQSKKETLRSHSDKMEAQINLLVKAIDKLKAEINTNQTRLKSGNPELQTINIEGYQEIESKLKSIQDYLSVDSLNRGINQADRHLQRKSILIENYKIQSAALTELFHSEGESMDAFYRAIKSTVDSNKQVIIEASTNLKSSNQELIKSQSTVERLTTSILSAAHQHHIQSLDILRSHRLSESLITEIEKEVETIKESETRLNTRLKTTTEALEKLGNITSEEPLESLTLKATEINRTKKQLSESKGSITQKITENEQKLKQQGTLQTQLKAQTKTTQEWAQLKEIIGDSKGDKYSTFAQSITLRNLIALANLRLRDLNDRYLLNNNTAADNLEVIDLYQGSTTRSISSLSGGESFILSLALALSLSDLASKNVHLESLFIDEGFGTLDAETLDTAMQTLEKLQSSSNKTIGVISHIESIKERIHTKIVLSKNTQGHSELALVSG